MTKSRCVGFLVPSLLVAAVLLSTSPMLPMAWDEGFTIERADGIARWAARWVSRDQAGHHPLSAAAIVDDWQYTTRIEGHPALPGIVIAIGRGLSGRLLSPLDAARFGPIMLFALAAGAMSYRLARDGSYPAAALALAALLLLPRLFAHAHFAGLDGPLASCWLLAWAVFPLTRRGAAGIALWGLLLGMTAACKITGWFALVPFGAWLVLVREPGWQRTLTLGFAVALGTFWLLNPPLWHHPIAGLSEFLRLNLQRASHENLNVGILFLGQMYDLQHPLPWYNTLLWTAITVPLGLLLLAAAGLVRLIGQGKACPEGLLLVGHWLVLLVVRALPGVPPHDGIRLFLPSFVFLAAIAGIGGATLLAQSGRRWTWSILGLVYFGSLSSLVWYAPQWLSYYNLLIGGLPGATAAGMEPTYYWDALDRHVLIWLDESTPGEGKVAFAYPSEENLRLLRQWGVFRFEYREEAPGSYRWYVLQRRPSAWTPADEWLMAHARPVLQKTIRGGGWGPWRLTVPLVEVYSYADYETARRSTLNE